MGRPRVLFQLLLSQEEKNWIYEISQKDNETMSSLIIVLLQKRSKELKIKLPKDRVKRVHYTNRLGKVVTGKKKFLEGINEEMSFL